MSEQNNNCPCPERKVIPVSIDVAINPADFPGGSGVEPGPDNTHLVSRGGELAWDPIVDDSLNYSTEEQWTGKLWIDGKKIYQKTFECGPMPSSGNSSIPILVDDIETLVELKGTAVGLTHSIPLPRTSVYLNSMVDCHIRFDGQGKPIIAIQAAHTDMKMNRSYVTLQYTCTGR